MIPKAFRALIKRGIVGRQHAAFACRYHLVSVETEYTALAQSPDAPSFIFSAVRLGSIFDDGNVVSFGDGRGPIHARRVTIQSDGHHYFFPPRNPTPAPTCLNPT